MSISLFLMSISIKQVAFGFALKVSVGFGAGKFKKMLGLLTNVTPLNWSNVNNDYMKCNLKLISLSTV